MTNAALSQKPNKRTAEIALIIAVMFWGATFVIVKESLQDISPMLFIALRFMIAFILLIPFVFKFRAKFTRDGIIGGSILGVILFLGFASQTAGLQLTTATRSAFITSASVVLVPVLQILIEKRRPANGTLIGVALVFIGILMLSSGGNSILTFLADIGTNFNFGDFLTLICAVSFAAYIVYLDYVSQRADFWPIFVMQIFVTAALAFIFAYLFNLVGFEPVRLNLTDNALFGIAYTALITTLLTTAILTKYQKAMPPAKAGIIYALEPIFASVIAFFVLSEKISNFGLIGSALIFMGLITSETFDLAVQKWKAKK